MPFKVLNGLGIVRTDNGSITAPVGGTVVVDGNTVTTDVSGQRPRFPFEQSPAAGIFDVVKDGSAVVVESDESLEGHFSTLFNNFELTVTPHYNFYVDDEEVNETEELGNRKLIDVPRYMALKWRRAPVIRSDKSTPLGGKRVRSFSVNNQEVKKQSSQEFSDSRKLAANGYISPGSITAVVEIPLANTSISDNRSSKIDELKYLMSDKSDVSIHDLQRTLNLKKSGVLRATDLNTKTNSEDKERFFDGNFFVDPSDGRLDLDGASADSPAISMKITTVTAGQGTSVKDHADKLLELYSDKSRHYETSAFTEVNFFDTSLHGIVDEEKINLMTRPEHVENMVSIGQYLPNLTILSLTARDIRRDSTLPSSPSNDTESTLEYVGYVIEKYRLGTDGSFSLIDEIEISSADVTEFIDTKVAYGATYRYRMRALFKWSRDSEDERKSFMSPTGKVLKKKASFFYTDWNRRWQYAAVIDNLPPYPPDEFVVRPESHRKRVVLTWKLPYNPQQDISHYRVFRKSVREDGLELSDWEMIGIVDGSKNGLFFDNDVDYYQSKKLRYVYAVQAATVHGEESLLSAQISARINMKYRTDGEYEISQVSEEGVDMRMKGAFSVKPHKRINNRFIFFDKCSLSSRLGVHDEAFDDSSYVVRLESLDKSVHVDIPLSLRYDNMNPLIREKVNNVAVKTKISNKVLEAAIGEKSGLSVAVGSSNTGRSVINTAADTVSKSRRG